MWFAANNILLMRSCNHALGEKMAGRFGWAVREWFKYKNKLGDRMIKQLSNSVIAKYCDLSMSRRSIICLSLRLRQIIDLLATDKSQYFAQPRPIIVKGWLKITRGNFTRKPTEVNFPSADWLSYLRTQLTVFVGGVCLRSRKIFFSAVFSEQFFHQKRTL